jgi:pimeloyl-ACP methyl ester carboxylesterase
MKDLLFAALVATCLTPALALAGPASDCHIGVYRLADGSLVDVGPTDDGQLRWRRFDGVTGALHPAAGATEPSFTSTLGWTDRPDGKTVSFSDCATGEIRFDSKPGRRIALEVTDTVFDGHGVKLTGRLVLPGTQARTPTGTPARTPTGIPGKLPIVVLIHGSEFSSARELYSLQRLLPAEGVGVFVYDKRGTGASGGKYTQDFSVLADDAVAAMREARRLAGPRAGRVGYQGGSQGGWVAPLAASRAPVDFVIVSFGLAVSPIEEDLAEIELEMKLAGHGPAEIAKAKEVAAAGHVVFTSDFTDGFDRFDALRARYKSEPWYKDLRGNMTRFLLPLSAAELRDKGKAFRFGTPFHYDSMPTLRAVKAAQLWILGEDDLDAPSAETSRRIKALGGEGRPVTLAMFPHADHGLTEYETKPDGERVSTRLVEGYYAMMRDFARDGRLHGRYGTSTITLPAAIR